jgi:hypothetical protein
MQNTSSTTAKFRTVRVSIDPIERSFRGELIRQRTLHAIQRRELDLSEHRRRKLEEKAQINWERRCEISAMKEPSSADLQEKEKLEVEAGMNGWFHPNDDRNFLTTYSEQLRVPKSKITLLATPEAYDQRDIDRAMNTLPPKSKVGAMRALTTLQSIQRSILIDEHEKDVRVPEQYAAIALSKMTTNASSKGLKGTSSGETTKNVGNDLSAGPTNGSNEMSSSAMVDIENGALTLTSAASDLDLSGLVATSASAPQSQNLNQGNKKRPRESTGGDVAVAAAAVENEDEETFEDAEDDPSESEVGDSGDIATSAATADGTTGQTVGGTKKQSNKRVLTEYERLLIDMKKAKERASMFLGRQGCDRCGTIVFRSGTITCGSCKRDFCGRGGKSYEDPSFRPCVELYSCLCGYSFCYECTIGSEGRTQVPIVRCGVCPKKSPNWMCRKEIKDCSRCPTCNILACKVCSSIYGESGGKIFESHVEKCKGI